MYTDRRPSKYKFGTVLKMKLTGEANYLFGRTCPCAFLFHNCINTIVYLIPNPNPALAIYLKYLSTEYEIETLGD